MDQSRSFGRSGQGVMTDDLDKLKRIGGAPRFAFFTPLRYCSWQLNTAALPREKPKKQRGRGKSNRDRIKNTGIPDGMYAGLLKYLGFNCSSGIFPVRVLLFCRQRDQENEKGKAAGQP